MAEVDLVTKADGRLPGKVRVGAVRLFVLLGRQPILLLQVVAAAEAIRIGDPLADETQMGPLCTEAQVRLIEAQDVRRLPNARVVRTVDTLVIDEIDRLPGT